MDRTGHIMSKHLIHQAFVAMGKKAIPWYRAGGIPAANCIAAYQAIGAADIATSYINQANPGTYNLTASAAPTFAAETGWTFNGSSQFLKTGITPGNAQVWSMLVRFSNVTGATGYMCGYYNSAAVAFMLCPNRNGNRSYWNGTAPLTKTGLTSESGVMGVVSGTGYLNGVSEGGITLAAATEEKIYIGAANGQVPPTPFTYCACVIQAFALYDCVLTTAQALALSNAMAALPFDSTSLFPSAAPSETGEFMVAFFTDSHINQTGVGLTGSEIYTMTEYLKNSAAYLNLQLVLYGGDYDNGYAETGEGAEFITAMGNLDNIPHLLAIGNHEYGDDSVRDAAVFNADFPQTHYTGKSWWSGGFYEAGHSENAYMLQTIDGTGWIFISLEMFPRRP